MHLIGKSPGKPCICSIVRCLCVRFSQVFFIAVFALLVPCFAFAEETPDNQTTEEEAESIEIDEEFDNMSNTVDYLGFCYYDVIANAPDDYDSEDSDYSTHQIQLIKFCRQLSENTKELRENYQTLKDNEQSLANRTLTAATTAATGIGGMELARGLSEQKADENADSDMMAYIETMRCSYGDKRVKAGPTEIELPGGNDANIMKYRNEYFALAKDLKERKAALGMKPGIESEEILEKTQMGLYDDENTGITAGAYESWYRAQMLESEKDKQRIAEMKEASSKRVKGGAIAAGAGVVGGMIGNAIINKDVKNRTDELVAKRNDIKSSFNALAQQMIEECNNHIRESGEDIELLKSVSDLYKIKDIAVCE